jgi:hypothetical protein
MDGMDGEMWLHANTKQLQLCDDDDDDGDYDDGERDGQKEGKSAQRELD